MRRYLSNTLFLVKSINALFLMDYSLRDSNHYDYFENLSFFLMDFLP